MSRWRNVRIADFCAVGSGSTPSRNQMARYYEGGTIPWVKSGELRETVINDTEEHVTDTAMRETALRLVPEGAVLIAMYGATIGRLGVLGVPATTNQAVCHMIPDPDAADIRYLFHSLRTLVPTLVRRGIGGAQPNISQGLIKDLVIPLPPMAEQRRIAAILDQAEDLRGKRRLALAHLSTLTQSIFFTTFGDKSVWPTQPLRSLVSEFRYGTSTKSEMHGQPALRIPNVVDGTLNLSDLKLVPVSHAEFGRLRLVYGDILFVRTNGNPDFVGRCAVFDPEIVTEMGYDPQRFVFASYLIRARLLAEVVDPVFVREFMRSAIGRRELRFHCKTSAGQFNLNTEGLGTIPVPVPPIARQREFATWAAAVDRAKVPHREALEQMDCLLASLRHQAFTASR